MKDQKKFKGRAWKETVGRVEAKAGAIAGWVHWKNQEKSGAVPSNVVAVATCDLENLNVAGASKGLN